MPLEILVHKPASRPDPKSVFPGVLQAGLGQFNTRVSALDLRRNAGMRENDGIPRQGVFEHSQVTIEGEFETLFFRVVIPRHVFGSHKGIFRGSMCNFDK